MNLCEWGLGPSGSSGQSIVQREELKMSEKQKGSVKKRVLTVVVLLIFTLLLGLWSADWLLDRRLWTANVRADAQWLVKSLSLGRVRPLAFHLRDGKPEDAESIASDLLEHSEVLRRTDFYLLTPDFSSSKGVLTATFACEGGVYLRFRSKNDGDFWDLFEVTKE